MDMSKWFKKAVCDVLDHPLIIADRFHFMRQVYWALDEARRKVQADVNKPIRLQMKRSTKLLWKSHFHLDEDQKEKVEKLLEIDPRIREAYQLKVMMERWFKESDHQSASKNLDHCLLSLKRSGIEAF